jgi:hypothetical protein
MNALVFAKIKIVLNNKNLECSEGGWADKIISVFINEENLNYIESFFLSYFTSLMNHFS